jgi:biopolymer transport protein ExbD
VAKSKLGHGGRKALGAALNLVAYIDMMTMLVIFLLMSFSASGEILFVSKNITLPDAQNWSDLERAPVIGVTKDVVTLDGHQVATAEELMKDSATGDAKIPELSDQLVTAKNNYKLLHPTEEFKGVCIIQADKAVEFKMLRKVMFSAATAGYQNVNFAVTPKTKGGAAPAAAE